MKMDTKWLRRSAMLALGACLVVGMTGCDDDDDGGGDGGLAGLWQITVTVPGQGSETIPVELPPGDFSQIQDGTFTFNDPAGSMTVTISGQNITWHMEMDDGSGGTIIVDMNGVINGNTSMSGSFTITIPGQGTFNGSWSAVKQ